MRTRAHIDIFALLVEADGFVLGKIGDMLNLIRLFALFHQFQGFFARKYERLNLKILLDYFAHLFFYCFKVCL